MQAAADAEAEANAQAHGLTTGAYRTKFYLGPSVLGPKKLASANPFAPDAQRSTAAQLGGNGSSSSSKGPQRSTAAQQGGGGGSGGGGAGVQAGKEGAEGNAGGKGGGPGSQETEPQEGAVGSQGVHSDQVGSQGMKNGLGGLKEVGPKSSSGGGSMRGSISSGAAAFTAQASQGLQLHKGDAARTVPLTHAYEQFRRLSAQMFQHPISEQVRAGALAFPQMASDSSRILILTPSRLIGHCGLAKFMLGFKHTRAHESCSQGSQRCLRSNVSY